MPVRPFYKSPRSHHLRERTSTCTWAVSHNQLGPNDDGRIQALQFTLRVGLDRIDRYILVFLGMPFIVGTIVKGAVGFEDVMDAIPEGSDKAFPVALKEHAANAQAIFDLGKRFQRNAVCCQVGLTG